jgi:hypothetical protein
MVLLNVELKVNPAAGRAEDSKLAKRQSKPGVMSNRIFNWGLFLTCLPSSLYGRLDTLLLRFHDTGLLTQCEQALRAHYLGSKPESAMKDRITYDSHS